MESGTRCWLRSGPETADRAPDPSTRMRVGDESVKGASLDRVDENRPPVNAAHLAPTPTWPHRTNPKSSVGELDQPLQLHLIRDGGALS
jgi:hypothetical protein